MTGEKFVFKWSWMDIWISSLGWNTVSIISACGWKAATENCKNKLKIPTGETKGDNYSASGCAVSGAGKKMSAEHSNICWMWRGVAGTLCGWMGGLAARFSLSVAQSNTEILQGLARNGCCITERAGGRGGSALCRRLQHEAAAAELHTGFLTWTLCEKGTFQVFLSIWAGASCCGCQVCPGTYLETFPFAI